MKKVITSVWIAILFTLPFNVVSAKEPLTPHELNLVIDNVNFIVGDGKGWCSATLISKEHRILTTAHHCLGKHIRWIDKKVVDEGEVVSKKVEVRTDVTVQQFLYNGASKVGGSSYKAKIIAYSDAQTGHDLAILQLVSKNIPQTLEASVLPISLETERGDPVVIVANPAMLDASLSNGIIASVSREKESVTGEKTRILQTNAGAFFGSSGGALLTDTGYYIGTVVGGIPGAQVIFAVHYSHLRDMLEENCFAELYDPEAIDYDTCVGSLEEGEATASETVKSILKEIRDSHEAATDMEWSPTF